MTQADDDRRIVHFHVGGRSGSTSLTVPTPFAEDVVLVLFDADEGCVAQAEILGRRNHAETISVPYFVGRDDGEIRFNINYDPYTSSAYELNEAFKDYYATVRGTDYVLDEVARPVRTVTVQSRSLDRLCFGDDATLTPPDVLTLDTQGSELDILKGASALLDDRVVAVVSEVQFNEVYRDAALFGELSAYLRERGFLFAAFTDLSQYAPLRGRIGARGDGLVLFGDALFLKDPKRIDDDLALSKLAFMALCHQQLEFAQLCLGRRAGSPGDDRAYLRLLDEFLAAVAGLPEPRLWTYAEAFDAETSRAFTQPVSNEEVAKIQAAMAEKAVREQPKLAAMSTGTGGVADLLERYGFSYAANSRRFQEKFLKAYRQALSQWQPHGFTPANDRGDV
jgi:FkbM family methyltransferase